MNRHSQTVPYQGSGPSRMSLAAFLERESRHSRLEAARHYRFGDAAERRADDLLAMARVLRSEGNILLPAILSRYRQAIKQLGAARRMEEAIAMRGVSKVTFTDAFNGHTRVKIDDYPPIVLPQVLAELLRALCTDDGAEADGFVAWKPRAKIAQAMSKACRREIPVKNLPENLRRLGSALSEAGVTAMLIQKSPGKGLRFAVRHHEGLPAGRDGLPAAI